jgi:hypothetical protein
MPESLEIEDPIVSIDPLEFARGAMCAASYVDICKSREVHISSLLDHFKRAGIASTEALKTLGFLRETQSLMGGFWIPTPSRSVPLIGKVSIVVAIQPTDELRRHFPGVQRAGSSRIADARTVSNLPTQSLKSWRGADGLTAATWAKSAIEDALGKLSPSMDEGELELFGARLRTGQKNAGDPAWLRYGDSNAYTWRGVGLLRVRTGKATFRHFLGRAQDKTTFLEGPPVYSVARMQFGLAALCSRPLHPIIVTAGHATTIHLPLSAPREVRRLLVALCEEVPNSFGRTWTCRLPQCVTALTDTLNELSVEVIERE